MDLFRLSDLQVHDYECRGFKFIEPSQELVFSIFFEDNAAPDINLTWSQLRGCFQFILETADNRRERVKNAKIQQFLINFQA